LPREGRVNIGDTACQLHLFDVVQHHVATYRKTRYNGGGEKRPAFTHPLRRLLSRSPGKTQDVSSWCSASTIDRFHQSSSQCRHLAPHASFFSPALAFCNTGEKSTCTCSSLHQTNLLEILLRRLSGMLSSRSALCAIHRRKRRSNKQPQIPSNTHSKAGSYDNLEDGRRSQK